MNQKSDTNPAVSREKTKKKAIGKVGWRTEEKRLNYHNYDQHGYN